MKTETVPSRSWIAYVVGGLIGAVVGGIVALNVMIYSGVARGYEAGLGEVFQHSVVAGIAVVGALVAGPVVGLLVAHRMRRPG